MFSILTKSLNLDDEQTPQWLSKTKQRYQLEENCPVPRKKESLLDNRKFRLQPYRQQDLIVKREQPALKRIIRKFRIQRLVSNFRLKMKRNIRGCKNIILEESIQKFSDNRLAQWITETEGWALSNLLSSLFSVLSIISIIALMVMYSLAIVFEEISGDPLMQQILWTVQMAALPVFSLEIFLNFVTKRYEQGHALVYLNQIGCKYIKGKFIMDFINLAVLAADIMNSTDGRQLQVLRFVTFLKFPEVLMKMQVIQNLYITTFYREQYWGLFIVLVINFTFAHILSILLNGMADLNVGQNWLMRKGLEMAPWTERYVWGYYWGTTIMLTVGFGDLVATNWQEALCLIFIEMISCISLAYNINCVGNLISNLRQQSKEKTQNIKTFQLMAKSNSIDRELENKINNYIEESFLMKNQFNFKEQDTVLEYLPTALRREYLKDVNKRIFKVLPFIKDFTLNSQYILAEHIIRKISHPDEVILNKGDISKCIILRKGLLGMVIKATGLHLKKRPARVIQTLEATKGDDSKLLNLGFISHRPLEYTLKSLTYSILYYFENQDLESYIRQNSLDFEHFCQLRDKFQTGINPQELYSCQHCPGEFHTRFLCPKLHYLPINHLVVGKYIQKVKTSKQQRILISRQKEQTFRILMDKARIEDDLLTFRCQCSQGPSMVNIPSIDQIYSKQSNESFRQSDIKNSLQLENPSKQYLFPPKSSKEIGFKTLNEKIILNVLNTIENMTVGFWGLELDLMHNWRYYFPSDNPKQLKFKKIRPRKTTI